MSPAKQPAAPKRQPIDDDTQARIVALYEEGKATAEITRLTHVARGSIYWVLERNGIRPNRVAARSNDAMTTSEVLDRLRMVERENGQLREQLGTARAALDVILDRLGITPEAAARVLNARTPTATKGKP